MNQFDIRVLPTGHVAPAGDNDIFENNRLSGKFPHVTIADLPTISSIPKGSTVVDGGAFIGDNTLEFVKMGWKVIAFEPFLDSWVCAMANAPGATIYNRSLGDGRKVSLVYDCPGTNHGMRSVAFSESGQPSVTVDSLELEECALIKIDVEGFEPFVLDGARETIKRFKPILFVESNKEALERQNWTMPMLEEKLLSLDYDLTMIGGPPRWDWLCVAKTPHS